ncbi:MAG: ABC transporter ATP-binding protein [Thermoanaerobaculia bacterium]|nr:ABC transporter ATP-binding protein [Thermoanaerobaculia bacterium]
MIEAQGLIRRFGPKVAVGGISFSVGDGEIVGILGPNGAGKTTTIRMMTGFLPPTAGRVTIGGVDLELEPRKARRQLGYLPENVALYPEMRVVEYLAYRARLHGLASSEARQAIAEAMESCLLSDVRHQTIRTLSKGYRQRVGLAQAILHRPQVLVLDEPTVGLDPKQIVAIRDLIRDLGRKRTLVLSSHILPEVELLCDRVLIIDRGRIVGEGTPAELRARAQGRQLLSLSLKAGAEGAREALAGLPGVAEVRLHPTAAGEALQIEAVPGEDLREAVFRAVVAHGWVLLGMTEERATLEETFLRLTTHDVDEVPPDSSESTKAGRLTEELPS